MILSGVSDETLAMEMTKKEAPYYIAKSRLDSDYLVNSILFVIQHQQQMLMESQQPWQGS